jgi:hypothetical protein
VRKADAVTTDAGLATTLFAVVLTKDANGGVENVASCGAEIPSPRQRPRNVSLALQDAALIIGPAGELPQLLEHNGYTASYFALRPGRVEVYWTIGMDPTTPKLADGSAVFRHAGRRASFKVRLTKLGRRMLSHHRSLDVMAWGDERPLHGQGGGGTGVPLTLSADTPAQETSTAL